MNAQTAARTAEFINRRMEILRAGSPELRAAWEASVYESIGWEGMEMEQRAYARNLVRQGLLTLNPVAATEKARAALAKAGAL